MPIFQKKYIIFLIFLLSYFGPFLKLATPQSSIDPNEDITDSYYKRYLRDYYYKQGKEFYNQEQYREALFKFKSALKCDPEYKPAETFIELVEAKLTKQLVLEESKVISQKEVKDQRSKEYFTQFYYNQGKAYFSKELYQEAIDKFKSALKWTPDFKPALKYLVLSEDKFRRLNKLEMQGLLDKSKKEEVEASNKLRDFYFNQGVDYFKKAQYNDAVLSLKRALEIDAQYKPAVKYMVLSEDKVVQKNTKNKKIKPLIAKEKKPLVVLTSPLVTAPTVVEVETSEKASNQVKPIGPPAGAPMGFMPPVMPATVPEVRNTEPGAVKEEVKGIMPANVAPMPAVIAPIVPEVVNPEAKIAERTISKEDKIAEIKEKNKGIVFSKKKVKEKSLKAHKYTAQQATAAETSSAVSAYRLDKEDVLEISVWRHPELSKEVIVGPDGMISYPLVNDIKALGLTITQLKEEITQGLNEFSKKGFKTSLSGNGKNEYLIGFGDTLDISLWKVPDLSCEVIVRPDGMISYPLIGDLKAAGITLVKLDEDVTKALSQYVKEPKVSIMIKAFGWKKDAASEVVIEQNPEVSIIIKKFGGRKVVVLGEVAKPGVYTFNGDIRLAEAVALAGDFTRYAVKNNILVIRGDIHKNPEVITADVLKLLKSADLTQNILIQSQDIIFVPRTLIGNVNTFIDSISPAIDTLYKGATLNYIVGQ